MNNHDFKHILQQKASEFKLEPKANAFENILEGKKQNAKRKFVFWMVSIAVFLVFVSSLIIGYTHWETPNATTQNLELINKSNYLKKEIFGAQTKTHKNKKQSKKTTILKFENRYKTKDIKQLISKTTEKTKFLAIGKIMPIKTEANELSGLHLRNNFKINYLDSIVLGKQLLELSHNHLTDTYNKEILPNTKPTKQNKGKAEKPLFSLSVFNHYMLLNNSYNGANNSALKSNFNISYNDKARKSYSAGFMFGLNYTKLSFSTGLAINQVIFNEVLFNNQQSLGSSQNENLVNDFGMALNVIDKSLTFVEIPLLAGYTHRLKKWSYNLEAGITVQYLIQTNTYEFIKAIPKNEVINKTDPNNNRFNKTQLGLLAAANVQYLLTQNWVIFGGPITKWHLNQYYKDEFTKQPLPFYVGINSGVKIIF